MNKRAAVTIFSIEIALAAVGGILFFVGTDRGKACETATGCSTSSSVNLSGYVAWLAVAAMVITAFTMVGLMLLKKAKKN